MTSILTNVLATLTGAAVAVGTVTLVEYLGHQIYPPPTDLSLDGLKAYVASAPWQALAIVVAGWTL
ncbi:MAG TPA: hypothetical protein DCL48_07290, partial [Alphaproteobacteria bacterium]|nr:hypothetical protein [Alphaproteobacteria bacterium]